MTLLVSSFFHDDPSGNVENRPQERRLPSLISRSLRPAGPVSLSLISRSQRCVVLLEIIVVWLFFNTRSQKKCSRDEFGHTAGHHLDAPIESSTLYERIYACVELSQPGVCNPAALAHSAATGVESPHRMEEEDSHHAVAPPNSVSRQTQSLKGQRRQLNCGVERSSHLVGLDSRY